MMINEDKETRIKNLSFILNNEKIRYLFLVTLISSDCLITKQDYEKSREQCLFIKNNIDLISFDSDDIKQEVLKFINQGLEIIDKEYNEKYSN